MNELGHCFNNRSSPFDATNGVRFGVIAKKKITNDKPLRKYLKGSLQWNMKDTPCFSKVIDREGNARPCVGPISFINHACERHSNVKVEQGEKNQCCITLLKDIEINEEVLRSYHKNLDCQRCKEEKKEKMTQKKQESTRKSKRKSTRISSQRSTGQSRIGKKQKKHRKS